MVSISLPPTLSLFNMSRTLSRGNERSDRGLSQSAWSISTRLILLMTAPHRRPLLQFNTRGGRLAGCPIRQQRIVVCYVRRWLRISLLRLRILPSNKKSLRLSHHGADHRFKTFDLKASEGFYAQVSTFREKHPDLGFASWNALQRRPAWRCSRHIGTATAHNSRIFAMMDSYR